MSSPQPLSRSTRTATRSLARRVAAALLAVVAVTAVLGSAQNAGAQDVGSQRAKVAKLAKELDRLRMQSASLNEDFLTAEEELNGARAALSRLGVVETSVLHVGEGIVDPLTTVVRVEVGESPGGVRFAAKRAKAARTSKTRRRR